MPIDRSHRFRRLSFCLVGGLALSLLGSTSSSHAQRTVAAHTRPGVPAIDEARYDPRATQLLKRMGEAYSRLGAFDLQMEISAAPVPLEIGPDSPTGLTPNIPPPPFQVDESTLRSQARFHLAFRQSNQLLMETEQSDPVTGKNFDLRWVSDGKSFWSYAGDKKVYTREKAPGSIHDFARLQYLDSGTLELFMLIGPNPFADILQSVDAAHHLGEANVRGIPTEVVSLQIEDPIKKSELRLYIGKSDSMLYRMEIQSIPIIPHEGPIKVGSKLDGLLDASKPPPIPQDDNPFNPDGAHAAPPDPPKPRKRAGSFLRFENVITLEQNFPTGTFAFVPPKDSLMLGNAAPSKK